MMKIRPFLSKEPVRVGMILLAGLVLRCLLIGSRGIWYDDAFSILLARQSFAQIIQGTAADTMPPLYYFLLHVWMQISAQIWWMRILSVLLSLGGMLILHRVVRMAVSPRAAGWALLWAAVSPFQIYHAQELRMYALLQLAQVLYVYFFLMLLRTPVRKWWMWAGFILSGAASLYTHNLAVFFLPVVNVYLLLQKRWKEFWQVLAAQAVMIALFLPWIFAVPGQVQKIQTAFWTQRPGLLEVVQAAVNFIGSLYPSGMLLMVISALSLVLVIFVVLVFFRRKTISSERKWLFGVLVFFTPAALFAASYLMRPIFVPRGFITSMLLFYGLGGAATAALEPKLARSLLGLGITAVALLSLPGQFLFDRFPRSPFNTAIAETGANLSDDSVILHDNKLSYLPAYVYHPGIRQVFLADTPGSTNDTFAVQSQQAMQVFPAPSLEQAVDGFEEVYFVVFERTLDDYRQLGQPTHPVMEWLNQRYRNSGYTAYQDLLIYHYQK